MKYTRRLATPIAAVALAALTILGACSSDAKSADSTALGADTALSRDLALANKDSAAQPQLQDVSEKPAATPAPAARRAPRPSTPRVAKTPSGNTVTTTPRAKTNPSSTGGGAVGTIAAGATLTTHASSKVCTNTNAVGDHVTATLVNEVSGSNGAKIPAGATVNLTVTQLKRSENVNDKIVMEFAVNSVAFGGKTYPIEASVTSAAVDRVRDQPKAKDAQKVGIGAVAGAIAGKLIGKSTKAAVIGGAAGAAVGAATAASTANYSGCINAGGEIVVTLNSPAQIKA